MKIRMRFSKLDEARFIGHLDIMRYFQKAFRRAGVDMTYSKGYSPHPELSFAAPLGVGLTSEGEYLDLQVNSTRSSNQMIADINSCMSDGLSITAYKLLPDDSKTSMSIVAAASYLIYSKEDADNSFFVSHSDDFAKYLQQDSIVITKDSKSGPKDIDIKPYIFDSKISKDGLYLFLSQGSQVNIRPEFILESFYRFLGLNLNQYDYQMHRIDLFYNENDEYVSLQEQGEDCTVEE